MIRIVLLAAVAFCLAEAGSYAGGYANAGYGHGNAGYGNAGYGHYARAAPHNGYESDVNKNNAARQLGVNHRAQYVGSGTGTARKDGVPGTPLGRTGYGHGYGHGNGHGNGYGHGYANGYGHGNQYGYAGNAGYGKGVQSAYGHGRANVGYGGY